MHPTEKTATRHAANRRTHQISGSHGIAPSDVEMNRVMQRLRKRHGSIPYYDGFSLGGQT
ncbi:hypothetical protein P0D75_39365 [Paraburkholderia sediminicola]|uniref:hypothetical protein n=1 Tax=Paraburkholderia sediminicola TaxID=458836 RepID=UPI0038BD14FF